MTGNGVLVPKDAIGEVHPYALSYIDPSINNDILLDYRELMTE
jgi:hypothetical protein